MILIADDNANVRRMIRSLIEEIDPKMLECEHAFIGKEDRMSLQDLIKRRIGNEERTPID